ncbi:PD-(D/E)XK motif protein [Sphingomonas sp. MG17]|uniref:PD-(D/E)XK motif protein n=1 Tax=Sphingomonas tagetis TaxID=2949092 RepID=A0A9X2HMY8_9SPHN|nr:PD-(D/E)XK motif protein [Sphingomonas tagetis]MCP3733112.1 PD-(D/E)XK motif protein [Sphingomonas tagetis]
MIEPHDPWNKLSPGSIDARRVDPNSPHDFFWIISGKGEPGLLLRVAAGVAEPRPLPKLRNLDLRFQDVAGSRALVLLLKDGDQRELFGTLCEDVVRAGFAADDNTDALHRMVRRAVRWHHLLRGGRNDLLSIEEQRGLLGELQFLQRLIDLIGPWAAVEAWKGPSGSAKDFELDKCLVEVKARRGAARPYVQISSEDQLSDIEGCNLFLVVSAIDAAIKPAGRTLTDHVLELERVYAAAEPEAYRLWELALGEAGFDFDHDYSDRRWTLGKTVEFAVTDGFPRITSPLTPGVTGVRYSIALDACAAFEATVGVLDQQIIGGEDGRSD